MLTVMLNRFGGVDAFSAEHRPEVAPGPGEVRVRIRAVGFNPVDVKARQGALGGTPPLVLGRDISGIVDAVGEGVAGFAVGDPVYARANEAYAESIVVPASLAALKPKALSFPEAAALPVAALTAYQAVTEKARTGPGDSVLVAGASGGVGSVAVQLLRHLGASPVLVTAGSDASAEYLTGRLGVRPEHVVRYRGKSSSQLAEEIRTLNGGEPVQAAFDFVGGPMKRLCFEVVGVDGHVVSIVEEPATFELNLWDENTSPLVLRSASFHFVQLAARVRYGPRGTWEKYGHQLTALSLLFDSGALAPVPITDVGPFSVDAVRRAHALLESGQVQGKVVASVGSSA